jgi:hypothetical protein
MKKHKTLIIVIVLIAAGAAGYWFPEKEKGRRKQGITAKSVSIWQK